MSQDVKNATGNWLSTAREGMQRAVSWNDLQFSDTVLPEWTQPAKDLIESYLGYLPHPSVSVRYEPYLRALLLSRQQGNFSDEEFAERAAEQIKLVRNNDMVPYGEPAYSLCQYDYYHQTFPLHGHAVKERLIRFLGYEPRLEHSLVVELWLRQMMQTTKLPSCQTIIDYKAITIIRYREVLLSKGHCAAEASPLLGNNSTKNF